MLLTPTFCTFPSRCSVQIVLRSNRLPDTIVIPGTLCSRGTLQTAVPAIEELTSRRWLVVRLIKSTGTWCTSILVPGTSLFSRSRLSRSVATYVLTTFNYLWDEEPSRPLQRVLAVLGTTAVMGRTMTTTQTTTTMTGVLLQFECIIVHATSTPAPYRCL